MSEVERRDLSRRPFVNKTEEMKVSVTPANSAAQAPTDQDEIIAAGDTASGQIFEQFQNT